MSNKKTAIIFPVIIIVTSLITYYNSFYCAWHLDDFHAIVDYDYNSTNLWSLILLRKQRALGFVTFFLNYKLCDYNVLGWHIVNFFIHAVNALLIYLIACRLFIQTEILNTHPQKKPYGYITAIVSCIVNKVKFDWSGLDGKLSQNFTCIPRVCALISGRLYAKRDQPCKAVVFQRPTTTKYNADDQHRLSYLADLVHPEYNRQITPYLRYMALVIAIIFAVHPIQTSAVTYIVQRIELLGALFIFLSFYFFLLFISTKKISSKIIFGVGGLLCIAFGAITKETIVVAPILMGAYIVIIRLKSWKSRLLVILFTSGAAITIAIFALIMFKAISFSNGIHFSAKPFEVLWRDAGESPIVYYSTQIRVLLRFLRLCIFPYGQCVEFWMNPSTSFTNLQVIFASGIHLSIIGFALFMWRKQPFILFGIFWFYIFLMPSSILPNGIFEHRIYTALAGLLFAIFIPIGYELLNQPLRIRKAAGIISLTLVASLILCFIFMSQLRNKIWKSEYSLWRECAATSPNNWRANVNYGYALLNLGKYNDAKPYLEKSFQQKSNVWAVANNLGLLYSYINDIDGSIRMFEHGLKLKPHNRMLKANLGACYLEKGLITKGTNLLYKARTLESFVTLGNYFLQKEDYDEALKCYERVLKKYPNDVDALAGKQACNRLR